MNAPQNHPAAPVSGPVAPASRSLPAVAGLKDESPRPSESRGQRRRTAALPYILLLLFTAVFYRDILFTTNSFIPWDLPNYHLPQAVIMSEALHQGRLPLWDPSAFCGRALYAQLGLQAFYPSRIFALLLADPSSHVGVLRALEIELVFHVFLAGVFAFWLGRRLGMNPPAALLSACGFCLGCYFASQAEHIGAVEGAAWLPLAWLGVVLLHEKPTFGRFALLSGSLSLMFLAGFTPAALPMFASVGLLTVAYAICRPSGWKPALLTIVAAAAVCVIAAIQFFPTLELVQLGLGGLRPNWRGTGGGIPLAALGTLVSPNHLGSFSWDTFQRQYEITLVYLYNGGVVLLLALLGILLNRTRVILVLLVLCCASGFLMLGNSTSLGAALFLALPRFIQGPLYPQHWMVVFSLSLSLLAGCGLNRLSFLKPWAFLVVAAAAADLIVMGSSRPMNLTTFHPPSIGIDEAVDAEKTALGAVRELSRQSTPPPRIDVYKGELNVWVAAGSLTGMPSSNGVDALGLRRLLEFRHPLTDGILWAYSSVKHPTRPLLAAMNTRYLMANTAIDPVEAVDSGLKLVKTFPGRFLYENDAALPRFFFAPRVIATSGMEESLEAVHRSGWEPAQEAVVERADFAQRSFTMGQVEVLRYKPESVLLRTRTPGVAFLASSETNYPGWRATIDGRKSSIYDTNVAFRGVVVPAGEHSIEFEFRPTVLYRSAWISCLSILAMCAAGIAGRRGLISKGRHALADTLERTARLVRP